MFMLPCSHNEKRRAASPRSDFCVSASCWPERASLEVRHSSVRLGVETRVGQVCVCVSLTHQPTSESSVCTGLCEVKPTRTSCQVQGCTLLPFTLDECGDSIPPAWVGLESSSGWDCAFTCWPLRSGGFWGPSRAVQRTWAEKVLRWALACFQGARKTRVHFLTSSGLEVGVKGTLASRTPASRGLVAWTVRVPSVNHVILRPCDQR